MANPKYFDRVLLSSTTTGTGTYSLGSAVDGYQNFDGAGATSGDTVGYVVVDDLTNPTDWEVVEGVFTTGSPATLTRGTVITSSNGGLAVNWAAGTRYIFSSMAAERMIAGPKATVVDGNLAAWDGTDGGHVKDSGVAASKVAKTDAANTFSGANTFTADQTFQSSDAGAGAGPKITIDRNSTSPAASDVIGEILFTGKDSAGNATTYTQITNLIDDPTDTSEDGEFRIATVGGGTLTDRVTVKDGVQIGSPTGGNKGAASLNVAGGIYDNGTQVQARQVASAFVLFDGTTGTILGSAFNVSSVTRNSTGNYTVTLSSALSSVNCAVFVNSDGAAAERGIYGGAMGTTSTIAVATANGGNTLTDFSKVSVAVFGP